MAIPKIFLPKICRIPEIFYPNLCRIPEIWQCQLM